MSEAPELPPERSLARLRYLNTPTSNWAADRIEKLERELEEERSPFNLGRMFRLGF